MYNKCDGYDKYQPQNEKNNSTFELYVHMYAIVLTVTVSNLKLLWMIFFKYHRREID